MTEQDLDKLWNQALRDSVMHNEPYTRYRFAQLVIEQEQKRHIEKPATENHAFEKGRAQGREEMRGALDRQAERARLAEMRLQYTLEHFAKLESMRPGPRMIMDPRTIDPEILRQIKR